MSIKRLVAGNTPHTWKDEESGGRYTPVGTTSHLDELTSLDPFPTLGGCDIGKECATIFPEIFRSQYVNSAFHRLRCPPVWANKDCGVSGERKGRIGVLAWIYRTERA